MLVRWNDRRNFGKLCRLGTKGDLGHRDALPGNTEKSIREIGVDGRGDSVGRRCASTITPFVTAAGPAQMMESHYLGGLNLDKIDDRFCCRTMLPINCSGVARQLTPTAINAIENDG